MSRFGPGTMMALIFAILIGLGGAYVVREYMKPKPEEEVQPLQPIPPAITVPVAGRDLKPGRTITLSDIVLRSFKNQEELRKDPIAEKAFMINVDQIIGRMVKSEIKKDDVFLTDGFYAEGQGPGVENAVSAGAVARTLPLTAGTEILQFVSPGSMVDVLFRTRPPSELQTVTLLQNVKVLAVGQAVTVNQQKKTDPQDSSSDKAPSVTVELSPYQSKWIAQVEGMGDLQIVLRSPDQNPVGNGDGATARVSMQQLIRMAIGEKKKELEVYLGSKQENVVFDTKPVYNDDLLVPIPLPKNPPAAMPKK